MSRSCFLIAYLLLATSPLLGCGDKANVVFEGLDGAAVAVDNDSALPADDAPTSSVEIGPCKAGAISTEACGKCGTHTRICQSSGEWTNWSKCTGESGECATGDSRSAPCGKCGTQVDTCSASCSWKIGACSGEGVCSVGATDTSTEGCGVSQERSRTCNSACKWDLGDCKTVTCAAGKSETRACGKCGVQVRVCGSDALWSDWSTCSGEKGVCAPSETRGAACGKCGSRVDTCSTTCGWTTGACTGEGVCAAGETRSVKCGVCGVETDTCSATCGWTAGACVDPTPCPAADAGKPETAPVSCPAELPSTFACKTPTIPPGGKDCTEAMVQEFATACFTAGGDCGAWQKKYPTCTTCVGRFIRLSGAVEVGACMHSLKPTSTCGTISACALDCNDAVCAGCDTKGGSGFLGLTSQREDCVADADAEATSFTPKGRCYDINTTAWTSAGCPSDTALTGCGYVVPFFRGACRDNANWTNMTSGVAL